MFGPVAELVRRGPEAWTRQVATFRRARAAPEEPVPAGAEDQGVDETEAPALHLAAERQHGRARFLKQVRRSLHRSRTHASVTRLTPSAAPQVFGPVSALVRRGLEAWTRQVATFRRARAAPEEPVPAGEQPGAANETRAPALAGAAPAAEETRVPPQPPALVRLEQPDSRQARAERARRGLDAVREHVRLVHNAALEAGAQAVSSAPLVPREDQESHDWADRVRPGLKSTVTQSTSRAPPPPLSPPVVYAERKRAARAEGSQGALDLECAAARYITSDLPADIAKIVKVLAELGVVGPTAVLLLEGYVQVH